MADTLKPFADAWTLESGVDFLNHGSFGATPRIVLEAQDAWRARMEREPVRFFVRELEAALDNARGALARFLGADVDDLAFVPNATHGVNLALSSLAPRLRRGDAILVTDHAYNACRNAAARVAGAGDAVLVVAEVPFPTRDEDEVVDAISSATTPRVKVALVEHVTSPTGLIWPIERIVRALSSRGVLVVVDGAHAAGMVPLDLRTLGAAFYTGNCHKWMCTPKGAGFLYVAREHHAIVRPLVVSHGANSPRRDRSRFHLELDWTGTFDPSAYLSVPTAIEFLAGLLPGGWPALRTHNRELALAARAILCEALGISPPAPDTMIGSLVSLPLPGGDGSAPRSPLYDDPLQAALFDRYHIEVPIVPWPAPRGRLVRVSAQIYNSREQYERLGGALRALLSHDGGG